LGKKVNVGLLGFGVVGSGVKQIIDNNQEKLQHQLDCEINVSHILVRNLEKYENMVGQSTVLTTNPNDVINNDTIDVIVEVVGGVEQAREYILQALQAGKHVVTANKDLIALHGTELHRIAKENNCDLFYEASVGGGIPLLRSISDGLAADRIHKIIGIVNGTTNYILTKMNDESWTYTDALQKAQELGFAEADPTADVEGLDAARKMVILARLAFLMDVELDDVTVSGISGLPLEDLTYGQQLGYTMKLIGTATKNKDAVEVSVQPTFLCNEHPLASVKNEYNAVYVSGEFVGETMFYGPGAGSLPTATAVMSDIVAVIKNKHLNVNGKQYIEPLYDKKLLDKEDTISQFYVRIHAKDETGAFANISQLFKQLNISFERIIQKPSKETKVAEIVIITHKTSLANFNKALEKLNESDVVKNVASYYRVEGDA